MDVQELLKEENAAWNAHDVDRIATFYTDDCIKEDLAVGVHARGKEAMNAVHRGAFSRGARYEDRTEVDHQFG